MNQIEEIRSCFDQKIRSGMFKPITRLWLAKTPSAGSDVMVALAAR